MCSAPGLHGRVYSAPSYSVAGGFPRRGLFIAAARGTSMTLVGPHCTWCGLVICFQKEEHTCMWPPNIGHCNPKIVDNGCVGN